MSNNDNASFDTKVAETESALEEVYAALRAGDDVRKCLELLTTVVADLVVREGRKSAD